MIIPEKLPYLAPQVKVTMTEPVAGILEESLIEGFSEGNEYTWEP